MNPKDQLNSIRYVRRGAAQVATAACAAADAADPAAALPDLLAAREALDKTIGAAQKYKGAIDATALSTNEADLLAYVRVNGAETWDEQKMLIEIIDRLTGKNVPSEEPGNG